MSSKLCFLTVGATASFSALIEAAVSPAFLTALESQGYTELSVQYGQDGKQLFEKCKAAAQATSKVNVTGFDLDRSGLGRHMRRAKGAKDALEGVVVSHAGKKKSPDARPYDQSLTQTKRLWLNIRRPPHRCPHHRRSQRDSARQPPS